MVELAPLVATSSGPGPDPWLWVAIFFYGLLVASALVVVSLYVSGTLFLAAGMGRLARGDRSGATTALLGIGAVELLLVTVPLAALDPVAAPGAAGVLGGTVLPLWMYRRHPTARGAVRWLPVPTGMALAVAGILTSLALLGWV
jgi:hypothetical protein